MSNWRNSSYENRYEGEQQTSFLPFFDMSSSSNRSHSFTDKYSSSDGYGLSDDRYSTSTKTAYSFNDRYSASDAYDPRHDRYSTSSKPPQSFNFNDKYFASDGYGPSNDRYYTSTKPSHSLNDKNSAPSGYDPNNDRLSASTKQSHSFNDKFSASDDIGPSISSYTISARRYQYHDDNRDLSKSGTYPPEDGRYSSLNLTSCSHDSKRLSKSPSNKLLFDIESSEKTCLTDNKKEWTQNLKSIPVKTNNSYPIFQQITKTNDSEPESQQIIKKEPKNMKEEEGEEEKEEFVEKEVKEENKEEEEGEEEEEEGEEGEDNQGNIFIKVDVFKPDFKTMEMFRNVPPSAQQMAELFKGLVICFSHRKNVVPELRPFVNMCESFRNSEKYDDLKVEVHGGKQKRMYCTLRYRSMMLARGCSGNNLCPEALRPQALGLEAKTRAAVDLVNKLAMSCYILQTKDEYYGDQGIYKLMEAGELPGVFRVIDEKEAPTTNDILECMHKLSDQNMDTELIFLNVKGRVKHSLLKRCMEKLNLTYRRVTVYKSYHLCVSNARSSEYWRDKILATGMLENEKFELIPPLGFGNMYYNTSDITRLIHFSSKKNLKAPTVQHYALGQKIKKKPWYWEKGNEPKWNPLNLSRKKFDVYMKQQNNIRTVITSIHAGINPKGMKEYQNLGKKSRRKVNLIMKKKSIEYGTDPKGMKGYKKPGKKSKKKVNF